MTIQQQQSVLHEKQVKQLSELLIRWMEQELAHLGVFECAYSDYDVIRSIVLTVSSNHLWRAQFYERDLDLHIEPFFKIGFERAPEKSKMKRAYNALYDKHTFKINLVSAYKAGFFVFGLTTYRLLNSQEQGTIAVKFRQLCYKIQQWTKQKKHVYREIRVLDAVKAQHHLQHSSLFVEHQSKSLFDDLALTAKELLYIEELMMNSTYKEIAYNHQRSQASVRGVLANIKRKLGHETMSNSHMMKLLRDKGVLVHMGWNMIHRF